MRKLFQWPCQDRPSRSSYTAWRGGREVMSVLSMELAFQPNLACGLPGSRLLWHRSFAFKLVRDCYPKRKKPKPIGRFMKILMFPPWFLTMGFPHLRVLTQKRCLGELGSPLCSSCPQLLPIPQPLTLSCLEAPDPPQMWLSFNGKECMWVWSPQLLGEWVWESIHLD